MTRSFFAPVLTDAGLTLARRNVAEDGAIRGLNNDAVITDAIYASLFAAGPAKIPPFGSRESFGSLTLENVRGYAERAFRPANAVLVVTGAVDPSVLASALPGRDGAAAGSESPVPETLATGVAPIQAPGPEKGFGLGWAGPAITDEREATAFDFIADYLFYPESGLVQKAVRGTGASLTGTFVTYHDPGVFLMTSAGGDQAAARAAVDAALAAIRKPLAAGGIRGGAPDVRLPHPQRRRDARDAGRHVRLVFGRRQSRLRPGRRRRHGPVSRRRGHADARVRRGHRGQISRSPGRRDRRRSEADRRAGRDAHAGRRPLIAAVLARRRARRRVRAARDRSRSAKLYAQNDAGAQLVGLQFVVSAGTARQGATQNGLAALAAQTLLLLEDRRRAA